MPLQGDNDRREFPQIHLNGVFLEDVLTNFDGINGEEDDLIVS